MFIWLFVGLPAIIVAITMGVASTNYGDDKMYVSFTIRNIKSQFDLVN